MNNKISVVLGSYNRLPLLKKTISSVRKELADTDYEMIVVEGGSKDGSIGWLLEQKDILTIIQHNHGTFDGKKVERRSWGYFMNLGFKCAQGRYICMISDDCLIVPGAILNGVKLAEERISTGEKIGAVAFYWRNFDEPKYYVSLALGDNVYVNHGLYLRAALEDVGYISEDFDFYCGDIDLCLKMTQKGYKCIDSKNSFVEHCPHTDLLQRKKNSIKMTEDYKRYLGRWGDIYSKNSKERMFSDFVDEQKTYKIFENTWYSRRRKIVNAVGSKVVRFIKKYL